MKAVDEIVGTAVPLDRADVDTDQIIPAEWLKRVERTGFGEGLFSAWRKNPEFVLNKPEYTGASILVAGPNFGCGSSREHAPWALEDYGFRAVISSSFADIFRGNCLKIGLVPAMISQTSVEKLMAAVSDNPAVQITVDVASRTVSCGAAGVSEEFTLDDFTQSRLLNGLDDIGLTMRNEGKINEYESSRASWLPST